MPGLVTDLKKMGCGGCGKESFEIFLTKEGNLIAQCYNCKGHTTIKIRAQIDYSEWEGEGGLGVA